MLLLQQIFSGKTKQEIIAILEENFIQVEKKKTKKIGEIYSGRYSGKKFLKEYTCEKLNLFFL